ncbi:hypothetical protein HBI56_069530 [Parastagonospora nodorum]|nr:hypothetical protein HBH52_106050 [Parastagonospora nodorum]KAH4105852.1 hypothetical protein HBH46_081290 [Parastagonospora nodorum]KAH4122380.1 hypothetical protein HBH47_089580 [Parastagonospora nodorum]KAH4179349.1 hypothetical protein HBH43_016140 [Parastagonospora nodorum]KAH4854872.1 hypothetical protein HBH75_091060 [Parastagonospora nodorum]
MAVSLLPADLCIASGYPPVKGHARNGDEVCRISWTLKSELLIDVGYDGGVIGLVPPWSAIDAFIYALHPCNGLWTRNTGLAHFSATQRATVAVGFRSLEIVQLLM